MRNCDINAVAVFVHVKVVNKLAISTEWFVGAQFWDFLLFDHVLKSWKTDSPARTFVRLAYKSYQMRLPFASDHLSILDGQVFKSHKTKHEEMLDKWEDYRFKNYRLIVKSKKSYMFIKAYTECSCGRKANLNCLVKKCKKCCLKGSINCKAHKK